MLNQILNIFTTSISSVWAWFERVLTSTGMRGILLVSLAVLFSVSFLIVPLRGQSGSSDRAKQKNNSSED